MLRPLPLLLLLLLAVLFLSSTIRLGGAHEHDEEEDESSCEQNPDVRVDAEFRPGIVTVNGRAEDWAYIDGPQLALLPALDFDEDKAYGGGSMTVTVRLSDDYKCPSVALMFQVGENATYQNMGGCPNLPGTCTEKSCHGHEIDIMHFSIGNAIPGRLYGGNVVDNRKGNENDSFGHLVDVYAWNPHCRYVDGIGPS
ncbi:Fip1 motif [Musa troglodytarum]|uniref:Fip1 motif n=1 Tax=Musa troglodytarum TaxID=320322 RepID=A0A9E7GRU5_9LILI|nr:Fip1 motif [Musa troglodytarum]